MVKTISAAPPGSRRLPKSAADRIWQMAVVWLLAFASLLLARPSWAAPRSSVNVVLMLEGSDGESIRRDLESALPARFTLQDPADTRVALSKEGVMGSFADSLSNRRVRGKALSAVHNSLKQQGMPALIAVRVRRGRAGAREMRVVLVMSEQVEPVVEEDITVGRTEKVGNKVGPLLAVPLEDIEAANEKSVAATGKGTADRPSKRARPEAPELPPPEPKEAKEPREAREPKEPKEPKEKDEPAAVSAANEGPVQDTVAKKKRDKIDFTNALGIVELGVDMGARKMTYSDLIAGSLRPYLAPGIVGYGIGGQFYPGAAAGTPFAKDIGVVFRYAGSLPLESKTRDGTETLTATWSRTAIGVRGRWLAGPKNTGPYLGLEGTYGTWSFVFEGTSTLVAEVPTVRYKYVRGAVDARFPFGAFSIMAAAGGMYVLSAGEFTDRFPHSSIAGVDGTLGGAYSIVPWLEARADANYTRIFSSAKPERGDAYIAGGALDEYFILRGGIAAVF
jgi:hypothetical protein